VARRSHPGRRLGLRGILVQIGQLKLELIQQGAAFRGLAKPLVSQLADRAPVEAIAMSAFDYADACGSGDGRLAGSQHPAGHSGEFCVTVIR